MTKKRLFVLVLVAVVAFTVGYGVVAKAFPTPYHRGYFYDTYDDPGIAVLPAWGGDPSNCYANGLALPTWIDTADEFIGFINCKLTMTDYRSHIGAAFIISTMTGIKNPYPGATEINDFAGRVRYAESRGWINWHAPFACITPNTYYQDNGPGDVAAYGSCDTSSEMITFSRDGGASRYIIKRICANPLGDMSPLATSWSGTGSTTVTDGTADAGDTPTSITTRPGDTLQFAHRIVNNGPSVGAMWYALYGRNDYGTPHTSYTAQYYSNTTLSGAPTLTRTDPYIAFNWGLGGPGGGVPVDGWSARWTKTDNFTAGNWDFTVVGDDGVRLYIDGVIRMDAWIPQGTTSYTYHANLTAGNHTIVMEYYEGGGPGYSRLDYSNLVTQSGVNSGWYNPGEAKIFNETVSVPISATPGSQFCRRVLWDWKNNYAGGDYGWGSAGMGYMACATVAADFNLTPTVSSPVVYAQAGDTIQFNYFVQNTGTASGSSQCYVRDQGGAAVTVPGLTCSASQNFPSNQAGPPLQVGTENFPLPVGAPVGTKICRTLFVQPASPSVPNRASTETCVVITKNPYVTFMGGDVWAGGNFAAIDPACNKQSKIQTIARQFSDGTLAGSGVEYSAFGLGRIIQFGSAGRAFLSASVGSTALTFSNIDTNNLGNYGASTHCIEDYVARFSTAATMPAGSVVNVAGPNQVRHILGSASFSGAMPVGGQQVYLVDGDATITAPITYAGSYASVDQVPSLVIIAKGDIRVASTVGQMDGIFVTRGTFYTCYPKVEPAVVSTCNTRLTVTGAVVAGKLDLFRTFGAEGLTPAQRKDPAEIFTLSPELYLRNVLSTTSQPTLTISDVRELPPRY